MKTEGTSNSLFMNLLLPGTILLANIDVTGLFDYALKALVGGGIWFVYKLISDRIDRRRRTAAGVTDKSSGNKTSINNGNSH